MTFLRSSDKTIASFAVPVLLVLEPGLELRALLAGVLDFDAVLLAAGEDIAA